MRSYTKSRHGLGLVLFREAGPPNKKNGGQRPRGYIVGISEQTQELPWLGKPGYAQAGRQGPVAAPLARNLPSVEWPPVSPHIHWTASDARQSRRRALESDRLELLLWLDG